MNTDNNNESTEKEIRQHATTLTKEQLYRELAVAAARLAGKSDSNYNTKDNKNNSNNKATNASDSTKDGDVGAGGAMVVGGPVLPKSFCRLMKGCKPPRTRTKLFDKLASAKSKNTAAAATFRNASSTAMRRQP